MVNKAFSLALVFLSLALCAQQKTSEKPKLVVGIVVDQMRYDYLYKFYNRFSEGGFKRLLNTGFVSHNTHYSYIPTYTGPGHASIYTGTTPSVHGIIANDWYSRAAEGTVYCVSDSASYTIGSVSGAGEMSPKNLLAGTLGDGLKLFTNDKAKVIGIALKDRGAILPAGHTANAAYWFDGGKQGKWITSSWYRNELPQWVEEFNQKNYAKKAISTDWNTLYPIETYEALQGDVNSYERKFKGEENGGFPHKISKIAALNKEYEILKAIPQGNTFTKDFAKKAIESEGLGADVICDLLAISFSSSDYIGHQFGVNSVEVEDAYLRLDADLADLFTYLDERVGAGKWLTFLTADHAGTEVPHFMSDRKSPAGYFDEKEFRAAIDSFLLKGYNAHDIIENLSNEQIFLNPYYLESCSIGEDEIEALTAFIQSYPGIDRVVLAGDVEGMSSNDIYGKLKKGFHPKFSGDILYTLMPGIMSYSATGSSHGSGYEYDTHVPLIFMGTGVRVGETYAPVDIEDIAPSVSALLKITWPNACTGKPIEALFKP